MEEINQELENIESLPVGNEDKVAATDRLEQQGESLPESTIAHIKPEVKPITTRSKNVNTKTTYPLMR